MRHMRLVEYSGTRIRDLKNRREILQLVSEA
jgi:hypothetical protein